ncbi:MAG: hypothetical protein M1813_001321 [Trichoglossum hirsutum]|nr:MAG: hypothetical protein M1813_001321 [Trichoglossum hirsutum]
MPKVNAIKPPVEKTETSHGDIFMSTRPEHISNIAARLKNHDSPVSSLRYIARISSAKVPGQIPEDGGLGNEDFNAAKASKFGYGILALWELEQPISLQQAKARGYLKGPPQNVFTTEAEEAPTEQKISGFPADAGSNG